MNSFLGGTGPEGRGLALRLAMAGEVVVIGSRDQSRAREAAQSLLALVPNLQVSGEENEAAAQRGDTVFVTVPYEAQRPLLAQLAAHLGGKVVINTIAPLTFSKGLARALVVEEGSAAQQCQKLLPHSRVVAAFQNLSAVDLIDPDRPMQGDVIVCSDHAEAKEQVMHMVTRIPELRAVDGGVLENARYVEELTALLLNINRIYKSHSTIKLLGL